MPLTPEFSPGGLKVYLIFGRVIYPRGERTKTRSPPIGLLSAAVTYHRAAAAVSVRNVTSSSSGRVSQRTVSRYMTYDNDIYVHVIRTGINDRISVGIRRPGRTSVSHKNPTKVGDVVRRRRKNAILLLLLSNHIIPRPDDRDTFRSFL